MVEVVPFLVLAVGVDNIFIIVQSYQVKMNMSDNRHCVLLSGRVAERGAAFMSHPAVLLVIVL